MHSDYYLVMVTFEKEEDAVRIAKLLVESRLARCCNILPGARSIYSWQGELCDERELVMFIKTGSVKLQELMEKIREEHPYELPEIMALPITEGDEDYLRWIWDWVSAEL